MSGELLSVRLLKPWGGHAPGAAVLVDRLRAVTLEEMGIGSIEPADNTRPQPAPVETAEFTEEHDGVRVRYTAEVHPERKAVKRAPRDKMVRTSKTKGKK